MKYNSKLIDQVVDRFPELSECRTSITEAYELLESVYVRSNKVLVCGNGGSAADSEHIVGELMKGFRKKRPVSGELKNRLLTGFGSQNRIENKMSAGSEELSEIGALLAENLQAPLPAVALTGHPSLTTAYVNDVKPELVFAQQLLGFGKPGDCLIGISTSGNSKNVVNAVYLARALDIRTIALTGGNGGKLGALADICICVPETTVHLVQELHMPVYHTLCAMLEDRFFEE
jgi:D-sedoheptulose 7-phosphate isomerase